MYGDAAMNSFFFFLKKEGNYYKRPIMCTIYLTPVGVAFREAEFHYILVVLLSVGRIRAALPSDFVTSVRLYPTRVHTRTHTQKPSIHTCAKNYTG